jgi:hypothetical protein
MEKRRSKRKIVALKAEIVSGGKSYAGVIENLSEDGIYIITTPSKSSIDFALGTTVELKFQPPSEPKDILRSSGETINLHCKVIWSYKTPPHGLTHSIGMEIINPSPEYKELLKTL